MATFTYRLLRDSQRLNFMKQGKIGVTAPTSSVSQIWLTKFMEKIHPAIFFPTFFFMTQEAGLTFA